MAECRLHNGKGKTIFMRPLDLVLRTRGTHESRKRQGIERHEERQGKDQAGAELRCCVYS